MPALPTLTPLEPTNTSELLVTVLPLTLKPPVRFAEPAPEMFPLPSTLKLLLVVS